MESPLTYVATVCLSCRRASLVAHSGQGPLECSRCGAACRLVPNAEYQAEDVPLFEALEQVVQRATLTASTTTLIAAELEAVGARWEPPELALARIAPKLPGLRRCYGARQDYAQLVLVVTTLLTIVCARLQTAAPQQKTRWRESGVRPAYRPPLAEPQVSPSAKRRAGCGQLRSDAGPTI